MFFGSQLMQLKKIFWTFGSRSGKKSWRALENNAILYNTERFMKGELDDIMLCTDVKVMFFVVLLTRYSKCKFWCWCFIRENFICHLNSIVTEKE